MFGNWWRTLSLLTILVLGSSLIGCGPDGQFSDAVDQWSIGKADDTVAPASRSYEVILTNPTCDVCTPEDRNTLTTSSPIIKRVVELINGAQSTIDAAQFTFSVKEIGQALLEAQKRGVKVRMAVDAGQNTSGKLAPKLLEQGLDLRYVTGKVRGEKKGLLHSKFMIVDGKTIINGSNNWSSNGTSINEENSIVISSTADDPLLKGFNCTFEAIWNSSPQASNQCSTQEADFTPGRNAKWNIIKRLEQATTSVDVLMHHLMDSDLIKALTAARQRGVLVRIIVNDQQKQEVNQERHQALITAGALFKFKRTNDDLAFNQLMHNKLAIVDGKLLLNGSGNWSDSAFGSNFENYVRYADMKVVEPFNGLFARLWDMSLTREQTPDKPSQATTAPTTTTATTPADADDEAENSNGAN